MYLQIKRSLVVGAVTFMGLIPFAVTPVSAHTRRHVCFDIRMDKREIRMDLRDLREDSSERHNFFDFRHDVRDLIHDIRDLRHDRMHPRDCDED